MEVTNLERKAFFPKFLYDSCVYSAFARKNIKYYIKY